MKQENFSIIKRLKSFNHAGRGLWIFLKTTHNAWLHILFFALAISLGIFFDITHVEWLVLVFVGGFVLVAEAFNTAIEIDINLTSPDHHPYAKDTKDVAAGAVLISAITALVIGVIIFGNYILAFFDKLSVF
ncbi:diacylglycerol kinase family protein [Patescibacteria group bacterium]|nr:diacylglycerol kinase family protein [Patescibacteria group bacterium]